jgi:hypothetical protein
VTNNLSAKKLFKSCSELFSLEERDHLGAKIRQNSQNSPKFAKFAKIRPNSQNSPKFAKFAKIRKIRLHAHLESE